MKNETLLKKLYGIKQAGGYVSEAALGNLDALIAEIKAEIEREGLPVRAVDISKAAAKFAKECWKQYKDYRPGIAGAFMYDKYGDGTEMRQAITDGYMGVSYNKPFDGLMEVDREKCPVVIDFGKIIPKVETPIEMPDYAELKRLYKVERMNKESEKLGKDGKLLVVRIGNGQYFNAAFIIRAMELAGSETGNCTLDGKGGVAPICFRNEIDGNQIECVVLPIRVAGDSKYLDSKYLLADYYKEA